MLKTLVIRKDPKGSGEYDATRVHGGKTIKHRAIDFVCQEGEEVFAPEDGIIEREAVPYANDPKYRGVKILGDSGVSWKAFYMLPDKSLIGKRVKKGQRIGVCQAISKKYGSTMKDHLHVEAELNGERVNPLSYLRDNQSTKLLGAVVFFFDSGRTSEVLQEIENIKKKFEVK